MLENKTKHRRYSSYSSYEVLQIIILAICLKTFSKTKPPQKAFFIHVKFNIPVFSNPEKNTVLYKTVKNMVSIRFWSHTCIQKIFTNHYIFLTPVATSGFCSSQINFSPFSQAARNLLITATVTLSLYMSL